MTTESKRRPGGARPNGPLLEREQIVDEATRLAAEHGLASVSMRQLGDRLGVTSMAIYWYLRNRGELIDAVAERVCSDISVPADLPWDAWLRARSLETHAILSRYAGVADHLLSAADMPPSMDAAIAEAVDRLADAGLSQEDATTAVAVIGTFVTGRAQIDAHRALTGATGPVGFDSDAILRRGIDQILDGIRPLARS